MAQTSNQRSRSRQSTIEPMRSRSNTAASRPSRHVRSRGSTASIQSNTTQYIPEQKQVPEGYQPYVHSEVGQHQSMYPNPEEMILRFGDQLANSNSGHEIPNQGIPMNGMSPDLQVQQLPPDIHGGHYTPVYEGVENQIPDQLMGDNDGSEAGPRKRRGATLTAAYDNELRRLLRQYDGWTLRQMASEVQKHEGAGGKSEKVKQVFAMIWLRENCQRCTGSVRRDRVYCCYADKCGSERVTLLNPASFGKLVRVIFPNVQTRRLGVRGESKYHYVDLSLKEPEPQPTTDSPALPTAASNDANGNKSTELQQGSNAPPQKSASPNIPPSMESLSPTSQPAQSPTTPPCTCSSPSHFDAGLKLGADTKESIMTRKALDQLLRFLPHNQSSVIDNDSLQLPNIHEYTPPNTDVDIADALVALYRSHCISVIDSFRYCKEKNLFRYFTSFQGTLTVPVQKLLVHPNLAPWIKECDWVMYQKMIACVSPLTTQVVPDPVLATFKSISRKLVSHIQGTLKSHPEHVSSARLMPARVFCHLVKRLLDVNQAANSAAVWLCRTEYRNGMWEDFSRYIDPLDIVSGAAIPPCSIQGALQVLKEQVKALLSPINDESPEVQLFDEGSGYKKFTYTSTSTDEYENFPDRWISFILNLSEMFPGHNASGIMEKAEAVWNCVLHRLTLSGAQSFSAWWMTKVFFVEMMLWQAEKGGFVNSTSKTSELQEHPSSQLAGNGQIRSAPNPTGSAPSSASTDEDPGMKDTNMETIPAVATEKPNHTKHTDMGATRTLNNDDSAIDLEDESVLLPGPKYGDMTASDPADADGDVVVI